MACRSDVIKRLEHELVPRMDREPPIYRGVLECLLGRGTEPGPEP